MLFSGLAEAVSSDDIGYEIVRGPHFRQRRMGRAVTENLFVLNQEEDLQRRPDLAYVSYERWPRSKGVPTTNAWDVVPDLAAEVVSPTNLANEILNKVHEYFKAGVRLVWVIYPAFEQIYVYESPETVRVIGHSGTLDGGAVLPEFRLSLADLFDRPEEVPSP